MDLVAALVIVVGAYLLAQSAGTSTAGAFDSWLSGDVMASDAFANVAPNIVALAQAIAREEGWYVAGSVPQRCNNPGDLKWGSTGAHITGATASGITIFDSPAAGWHALYRQLEVIANGTTTAGYTPSMTFAAFGSKWADGDRQWGRNVSALLGTTSDASIAPWMG